MFAILIATFFATAQADTPEVVQDVLVTAVSRLVDENRQLQQDLDMTMTVLVNQAERLEQMEARLAQLETTQSKRRWWRRRK